MNSFKNIPTPSSKTTKTVLIVAGVLVGGYLIYNFIGSREKNFRVKNNPIVPQPESFPASTSGSGGTSPTPSARKKVYANEDKVNLRTEPKVNDGFWSTNNINQMYGQRNLKKGQHLGYVLDMVDDKNGAKNQATGKVWKWYKVEKLNSLADSYIPTVFYVREDISYLG